MVLEGLDVHYLNKKDVSRRSAFDLKGTTEIVNLGQVNVANVIGRIIIANLASSPEKYELLRMAMLHTLRTNLRIRS